MLQCSRALRSTPDYSGAKQDFAEQAAHEHTLGWATNPGSQNPDNMADRLLERDDMNRIGKKFMSALDVVDDAFGRVTTRDLEPGCIPQLHSRCSQRLTKGFECSLSRRTFTQEHDSVNYSWETGL